MTRATGYKATKPMAGTNPLRPRDAAEAAEAAAPEVHIYGRGVCDTDSRGYPTPDNRTPLDIVVDASEGIIPLWAANTTLRWRFQERSMLVFEDPDAAKAEIKTLFGEALMAWGDAAPVKFAERADAWDFEIVMRADDRCTPNGCVLASAFFPDSGRHELILYPKMFEQSRKEQVDTFVHEIGHVFGLRHFFADISERRWPSRVFGTHSPFSIMNYGSRSELTPTDKSDLIALYESVWAGELTEINGTPIKRVTPFHALAGPPDIVVAGDACQPLPRAAYSRGK